MRTHATIHLEVAGGHRVLADEIEVANTLRDFHACRCCVRGLLGQRARPDVVQHEAGFPHSLHCTLSVGLAVCGSIHTRADLLLEKELADCRVLEAVHPHRCHQVALVAARVLLLIALLLFQSALLDDLPLGQDHVLDRRPLQSLVARLICLPPSPIFSRVPHFPGLSRDFDCFDFILEWDEIVG